VSTPDAAYTAHTLSIPAGALASDVTFTLQPPPVSLGVIGAVQVDGSTPGVSFTIPATLTLEYLDSDVDSGLGQVEGAMQVSQLVETSPASFEWISLGGAQAVDRVNNLVTFQMSDIDPFPSSGPPGIFAAIPAETIERVVGFIKPSGTGAAAVVTNGTGGATLGVGAGGYYSQHRLEFPGYENTSLFDPERITVIIQTASLFERESLVGGNSFPTGSGAIMAIETRNASGELIAFTDPFNIRVEFKPSDQIDFSGFPRPGAPLVLVKDVLSDAQVDFQPVGAVGTSSSIVDVSGARVLEVTSISDLTGAAGRGAWGLVAYDDPMPTPIPLSLWEFAPDITVPIGTGAGSFPGDAALTETRTPDEDLDSFGTDLAIGTTNLGTAQAFAHWDSPPDLIPFDDGATHRVIWRIAASGFADPANIPQIRLRANYGFTGGLGATDVVVPETAVAAPTITGETTYELIFDELEVASANGTTIVNLGTPFDGLTSTENAKRLFFDWVDFEGAPAPLGGGTLELESVIIQRLDKVNLLALSANERTITDFTQGVSVDQFGGAIDTSPGSSISVSFAPAGAMISSSGTNTTGSFQLWNALSLQLDVGGVAALPFAPSNPTEARIYRAEVGLAGLSGSPDVPQLRVIINGFDSGTAVNTLSTEFLINAVRGNVEGDSTFNPAIGAMEFSAYLALPSNQPTFGGTVGDRIQASLTLVDQDTPYVSGGSVTINRIQIDSIPVSVLP
jgi:hypothetical protein